MSDPSPLKTTRATCGEILRNALTSQQTRYIWLRSTMIVSVVIAIIAGTVIWNRPTPANFAAIPTPARPVNEAPAAIPNGGLVADEASLDFGKVLETSRFPWRLALSNPTGKDITVTGIDAPMNCTVIPQSFTVPAGGEAAVDISFNFQSGKGHLSRSSDGSEYHFVPSLADFPGKHPGWQIKGSVRRILYVPDEGFDFGYLLAPLKKTYFTTVQIYAVEELQSLTAQYDSPHVRVDVASVSGDTHRYKAKITLTDPPPHADLSAPIAFEAVLPSGESVSVGTRITAQAQ